ncbi:MAG: DUF3365 domain-containing protein [Methylacidiphilales bacterium]|nr:DUF3365 domain-containing protein [Candidatus Methylacidiphilales bacterium]
MKLLIKFNLAFIIILAIGVPVTIHFANKLLIEQANKETLSRAKLVLEIANTVRAYTQNEVRPVIEQKIGLGSEFIPISVPAFSSQTVFTNLKKELPEYGYKEASRNPTNIKDKALEWEDNLIEYFIRSEQENKKDHYIEGKRITDEGDYLYIAKPMHLKDPACLICHSDPSIAPVAMKERYGLNGFGYKLHDLIAVQIVSVPLSYSLERVSVVLQTITISILAVAFALWILLNFMLYTIIINPIQKIAEQANLISTGKQDLQEIPVKSKDEIGELTKAFNRMQRSMLTSLKIIQGNTVRKN